jgi:hypothetical protein
MGIQDEPRIWEPSSDSENEQNEISELPEDFLDWDSFKEIEENG